MTDKSLQWRQLLADCAASGVSVQRWCAENSIPEHRYYYWRRKLANSTLDPDSGVVEWLGLPVSEAPKLSVRIGSATIEICSGFDPALLRAVVCALEPASC